MSDTRKMSSSAPPPATNNNNEWSWLLPPLTPLIMLVGCHDIHQSIIDTMANGTNLRFVSAKLQQGVTYFPKRKAQPRRLTSYDGYKPDGILPVRWLIKHRDQVPSVVALLFQWDDPTNVAWLTQDTVNQTKGFQNDIHGREVVLMVVIVLNIEIDGSLLAEARSQVLRATNLDVKNVFVMPTSGMRESLARLKVVLRDNASTYYRELAHRTKRLRDRLNKVSQCDLAARHHFKIGVFLEAAGDRAGAAQYYSSSLNMLHQYFTKQRNLKSAHEIKCVAYVIVFKLIAIEMSNGNVQEALTQFNTHVSRYQAAKMIDLEFQHYKWMAEQYRCMGKFLEDVSSPASHTRAHNPGFYYQTAAHFSELRKVAAMGLLPKMGRIVLSEKQLMAPPLYVGQVNVGGEASLDSTVSMLTGSVDPDARHHHVLQHEYHCESLVKHSQIVIEFLTKAYEQFKNQKSTRMILAVASRMADEYFDSKQFDMAKKFYDRIGRSYRKEGWRAVLSSILRKSYECACHLGNAADIVHTGWELIGRNSLLPPVDQSDIFDKIMEAAATVTQPVVSSDVPVGLSDSVCDLITMNPQMQCFGCVGYFFTPEDPHRRNAVCYSNEPVTFTLELTSNLPRSAKVLQIAFVFSASVYNYVVQSPGCTLRSDDLPVHVADSELFMEPHQMRSIPVTFTPLMAESTDLELSAIYFFVATESTVGLPIVVKCDSSCVEKPLVVVSSRDDVSEPLSRWTRVAFLPETACAVLTVKHDAPAIAGEYYRVCVTVLSEDDEVTDGKLIMSDTTTTDFRDVHDEAPLLFYELDGERRSMEGTMCTLSVPHMKPKTSHSQVFCIRSNSMTPVMISLSLTYAKSNGLRMVVEQGFHLPVTSPLSVKWDFFSRCTTPAALVPQDDDPMDTHIVLSKEVQVIRICLSNTAMHSIVIHDYAVTLSKSWTNMDDGAQSHDLPLIMRPNESFTTVLLLLPRHCGLFTDNWLSISWSRHIDDDELAMGSVCKNDGTNTFAVNLPPMRVMITPFHVNISYPPTCELGRTILLSIVIANRTNELQTLDLLVPTPYSLESCMDTSSSSGTPASGTNSSKTRTKRASKDAPKPLICFSGQQSHTLRLLPMSTHKLNYRMSPLECGSVTLPLIHITPAGSDVPITNPADFGTSIFVYPRAANPELRRKSLYRQ